MNAWKRVLLALVVSVATLELGSWLGFWYLDGRRFTFSALAEERSEVLAHLLPDATTVTRRTPHAPDRMLHPYTGYVYLRERARGRSESNYELIDLPASLRKRSPDRVIVGVVGGSVAVHFTEKGSPELERLLKKVPAFADKEFAFLPLCYGGFKQPQQLMTVSYLLARGGELDILINLDGFNEVALPGPENVERGVPSIYPRSWRALGSSLASSTQLRLMGDIHHQEQARRARAEVFSAPVLGYSVTANLVWRAMDRRSSRALERANTALREWNPDYGRLAVPDYADDPAFYDELVAIWSRSSRQLHILSRANDIEYFHFLQPNQYFEGSKPMAEEERRRAINPNHIYRPGVDHGYPRLRREGAKLAEGGVPFHDLSMAFQDHPEPFYVDTCCHFDLTGNELIAAAVAREIIQRFGEGATSGAAAP